MRIPHRLAHCGRPSTCMLWVESTRRRSCSDVKSGLMASGGSMALEKVERSAPASVSMKSSMSSSSSGGTSSSVLHASTSSRPPPLPSAAGGGTAHCCRKRVSAAGQALLGMGPEA